MFREDLCCFLLIFFKGKNPSATLVPSHWIFCTTPFILWFHNESGVFRRVLRVYEIRRGLKARSLDEHTSSPLPLFLHFECLGVGLCPAGVRGVGDRAGDTQRAVQPPPDREGHGGRGTHETGPTELNKFADKR